jgi:hypothetical protein
MPKVIFVSYLAQEYERRANKTSVLKKVLKFFEEWFLHLPLSSKADKTRDS